MKLKSAWLFVLYLSTKLGLIPVFTIHSPSKSDTSIAKNNRQKPQQELGGWSAVLHWWQRTWERKQNQLIPVLVSGKILATRESKKKFIYKLQIHRVIDNKGENSAISVTLPSHTELLILNLFQACQRYSG